MSHRWEDETREPGGGEAVVVNNHSPVFPHAGKLMRVPRCLVGELAPPGFAERKGKLRRSQVTC